MADLNNGKRLAPVSPQLAVYLDTVARRCRTLPLNLLNPSSGQSTTLRTEQVFINLDASAVEVDQVEHKGKSFSEQYSAALAHIHDNTRLILLGDPGSGKTTLLRFLAYCLARAARQPDEAWLARLTWRHTFVTTEADCLKSQEQVNAFHEILGRQDDAPDPIAKRWRTDGLTPVLVSLKDFAKTAFDPVAPQALWRFICQQLEADDLVGAIRPLRELAQQGRVIFLLDGADEAPLAQQPDIWRAVAALDKGPYGGNRWVATCRVLSFTPNEAPPGVPVQTLRPLDEAQIDHFVSSWYVALAPEIGAERAGHMTRRLQAAVRHQRIRSLAENPMLLTIMAILQTYYGGLPEERARLYQLCVETLLLRWQTYKELPNLADKLGTSQENLERLLWEIAWQAHSSAPTQEEAAGIAEEEVIRLAKEHLGSYGKAEQFVEYTERRAHLLVRRGGQESQVYAFPHRTFQEYLAACYLATERRFGRRSAELAAQGGTWREVLNLAAGVLMFVRGNREKLLDGIAQVLPEGVPTEDVGWTRVWLAGEMLLVVGRTNAEKDEVGQEVLIRLRPQLAALVTQGPLSPRQRAEAGVTLGWLGDPRPDVACEVPRMVTIPAGPFLMGSTKEKDQQANDREEPQHTVILPAYRIGKYPVTVSQYQRFVADGGYQEKAYWTEAGWHTKEEAGWTEPRYWHDPRATAPNQPVVGVSWYEAVAYCCWLSVVTGHTFRLPDEVMWEKAARGCDGRLYPWDDKWDPTRLNAFETDIGQTTPVGMFPGGVSPFGVYDASGNVWEWCSGLAPSSAPYPFQRRPYEADLQGNGSRSLRGGAFYFSYQYSRAAFRSTCLPYFRVDLIGFRVAEQFSESVS